MKKIQSLARILCLCVMMASVGVAFAACSTNGSTVIVKKAPHKHAHPHRHLHKHRH